MAKGTASASSTKATTSPSALHPPYFEMISEAITTLKERTGSSQPAIVKFMEEKYKKVLPSNFKKVLSVQLKKFVKSERLVKVKNSYKMSSTEKLKLVIKETQKPKEAPDTKKGLTQKDRAAKKVEKGAKTKRLSLVKTPDAAGSAKSVKMKRLSQVKTPDGWKKKKNLTPMKRQSVDDGGSSKPKKKARK